MMRAAHGVAVVCAAGAAAAAIEDASGPPSLFAMRAVHWVVTAAALGYPLVFAPRYDLAFVGAWVAVMVTWAVFDNACVLSLLELAHPLREPDPRMRQLPWPWPAFLVLLGVVAFRLPSVPWCPDRAALLGALATYVAVHRMIFLSQAARTERTAAAAVGGTRG